MSTISSMLGAEAPPMEVEALGRKWHASPLTQASKAAWERRMKAAAKAALGEVCQGMPPAVQAAAAVELAERMASHQYAFFGPRSREALATPEGLADMAALVFGVARDEAESLLQAAPVETMAAVLATYKESLGGLAAAAAPGEGGGGGPKA